MRPGSLGKLTDVFDLSPRLNCLVKVYIDTNNSHAGFWSEVFGYHDPSCEVSPRYSGRFFFDRRFAFMDTVVTIGKFKILFFLVSYLQFPEIRIS